MVDSPPPSPVSLLKAQLLVEKAKLANSKAKKRKAATAATTAPTKSTTAPRSKKPKKEPHHDNPEGQYSDKENAEPSDGIKYVS